MTRSWGIALAGLLIGRYVGCQGQSNYGCNDLVFEQVSGGAAPPPAAGQ